MILTGVLIAVGVIAGIGIAATFWNDMVSFLKSAIEKVKNLVSGVVYGCKVFIKKISDGFKEISRHYSKVEQHWEETTITRTVPESEVPPEILKRAESDKELDITDELEMQLESA